MPRTLLLAIALSIPGCATLDEVLVDTASEAAVYVVPEEQEMADPKEAPTPGEPCAVPCDAEVPWRVTVIRLKHAKAEQLAETLSGILPPGMTVFPDSRTNSLIVSAQFPSREPIAPE